jgi:antitoxin MazE
MRSQIIQIGNSKGIRIPRPLLEQCQLEDEVELEAQPGQLVVRPVGGPRHGWAAAFEKMAQYGDDELLDGGGPETQWSRKDWKW